MKDENRTLKVSLDWSGKKTRQMDPSAGTSGLYGSDGDGRPERPRGSADASVSGVSASQHTLHIFSEYEISGLQDYLSAIPDESIRTRQLGVCLVLVPLLYLFITFLLRTFSGGGIGKLVDKKAAVLKKKGITQIAEQAQSILQDKDSWDDSDKKWHIPLWNVDEMQGWGSYWAENYCKNVLLEIYKGHSDAGDREASYRIGLALYPSVKGRYYAERSQRQGHPKAYNLVCSYDSYGVVPNERSWKKPETEASSPGSLLGELLGDAARKLDDYHRERNENEIDKARMLGDISAEEAAKLKDKYGKRKEW